MTLRRLSLLLALALVAFASTPALAASGHHRTRVRRHHTPSHHHTPHTAKPHA